MGKKRKKQAPVKLPDRLAGLSRVADSEYVSTMTGANQDAAHSAMELAEDARVKMWFQFLNANFDMIASRGSVSREILYEVLDRVHAWEVDHPEPFKNKVEATLAIASMLDGLIQTMRARVALTHSHLDQKAFAADLGEALDLIFDVKSNVLRTSKRLMLPEGQGAVDTYLQAVRSIGEALNGKHVRPLSGEDVDEGVRLSRLIWARLRNARVFEIPERIYHGLDHQHSMQFQAGVGDDVSMKDAFIALQEHKATLPYPGKLPFDTMYIGIGKGIALGQEMAKLRLGYRQENIDKLVGAQVLGYLVSENDRQIYEVLHVILSDDDFILPLGCYHDTWSLSGGLFTPWIIHGIIDLINEHNTVVINPSLKMKHDFKKAGGKRFPRFLPKPYYTLRMRHKVIDESNQGPKGDSSGHMLTRRYDRRGHERCYIERGPLPLEQDREEKLLTLGYRFIVGKPDAEDADRIAYRDMKPKSIDEWMAIKVRWIEDTVVGDESLPYVPAVRIPDRRMA